MEFLLSIDLALVYILFKHYSIGYGNLVDPVAWGLVDFLQKDSKIKQYLLSNDIIE